MFGSHELQGEVPPGPNVPALQKEQIVACDVELIADPLGLEMIERILVN